MPAGAFATASSNAAVAPSIVSAPSMTSKVQPSASAAVDMDALRSVDDSVPSESPMITAPGAGAAANGASTPMLVGAAVAAATISSAVPPPAAPLAPLDGLPKFGSSAGIAHEARRSDADAASASARSGLRMELSSGTGASAGTSHRIHARPTNMYLSCRTATLLRASSVQGADPTTSVGPRIAE